MSPPRAVLIDPQIYDCLNLGGVAMTQGVVARLRGRWPNAELLALTESPSALAAVLPGVTPVPYAHLRRWTADTFLLGPVYRVLPDRIAGRVVGAQRRAARRFPGAARAVTRARMALDRRDGRDFRAFASAIARADLVVVSGGNGPCEAFPAGLRGTLTLIEWACARGVPTALMSQGAGEVTSASGNARVRDALAGVGQVCVRERRAAPARFAAWGVPAERLAFGADDAMPQAYAARPSELGSGLGLNLRLSASTGVGAERLAHTRDVLHHFLRTRSAPAVPVPIAVHHRTPDPEAIRTLLAGHDDATDGGAAMRQPAEAIAAAGQCRVVVTGAYHAAVFALSQGASVVTVAGSELYANKFAGLAHEYGDACRVVTSDDDGYQVRLAAALDAAWEGAAARREPALETTRRLIAANDAAYERLYALAEAGRAAAAAGGRR